MKRAAMYLFALGILTATSLFGAFAVQYPGLLQDLGAEIRYASWADRRADLQFYLYNLEYFQQLQLDPTSGMVTFPAIEKTAASSVERAKQSYHQGDFTDAIHQLQEEIRRQGPSEEKLLWLALAQQRRAELGGCLEALENESPKPRASTDNRRICALPAATTNGHGARAEAARILRKLLDDYDSSNQLYRWLLSFNFMTMGRFPEGVPERYRIESPFIDAFYGHEAEETSTRYEHLVFHDRARELGVDIDDAGKGVAVEDFDGDGFLDLVTGGSFSDLRYFHNDGGSGFLDHTTRVGLGDVKQPFIITAADYDNDGWMDLFVGRPYHVFVLFRNRGDGTFEDTTAHSGLLDSIHADQSVFTFASAWADIDNDGDLDLFLAQLGRRLPFTAGLLGREPVPSMLFSNQNGHFTDATEAYGLGRIVADRTFTGAAFGDFDDDGDEDLFLSSFTRGASILLRNEEGRRFVPTDHIHNPDPGFMASFVDIDHDGRLDLFQGSNGPTRRIVENVVFGSAPEAGYRNQIYLQRGGSFRARPDLFGAMHISTMGASFGDLDNDGCHDFYLGTGNSEPTFVLPNLMFAGRREGTRCTGEMDNLSMLHGFGSIQKGHGNVFFDFDNDGDQDIYSSLGGMWPADPWPNQLFVNESRLTSRWTKIRLVGRSSNRFGVGARIRVVAIDASGQEIVRHQRIGPKTGFGSSPYLAHVGLLDAVEIDRVEVRWPGSSRPEIHAARLGTLNMLEERRTQAGAL